MDSSDAATASCVSVENSMVVRPSDDGIPWCVWQIEEQVRNCYGDSSGVVEEESRPEKVRMKLYVLSRLRCPLDPSPRMDCCEA